MIALVLINNNLKYDTRVKRHIETIAGFMEYVHVLARPVPDRTPGISVTNMVCDFFDYKPSEYPISRPIMDFSRDWNLEESFLKCFPALSSDAYYESSNITKYNSMLHKLVSGGRWKDIRDRVSEKMELDKALSYPLIFFDTAVQFSQKALTIPADIVLCNDVDTLLCGVVHKLKYGSRLVYDFHDIFADMSDGVFPQMYSNVLTLFEKQFIQYADVVMSVSGAALQWSKKHYGFHAPAVPILNCSDFDSHNTVLPQKTVPTGRIRIYYHGMSDSSRGLWELVQAIGQLEEFELVLRCLPSEALNWIKVRVRELNLQDKVKFLDPVASAEIPLAANMDGDIGYHFCNTKSCLNWRFALTNKFIEYTKAGLPIITSDTVEQGRIIRKYKNGWILEGSTVEDIVRVLKEVARQKRSIPQKSKNSFRAADALFDWNKYKKILRGILLDDKILIIRYSVKLSVNSKEQKLWKMEDEKNFQDIHTLSDQK